MADETLYGLTAASTVASGGDGGEIRLRRLATVGMPQNAAVRSEGVSLVNEN